MTEADTPRGRGRGPRRGDGGGAEGGGGGGGGEGGEGGRRGFGRDRRGRGDRRGRRGDRRGSKDGEGVWTPVTRLGRLVKAGHVTRLEEIYLYAIPVKEYQIIDTLCPKLKDEIIRISPVQKQTTAGQRTRFQASVLVGDNDGHIGLGQKCSKEVANAIKGAMILAKLAVIPVRRGYWGAKIGAPHTVVAKCTGKTGTAAIRFIPAPRGTGLVASLIPKKVLVAAGIEDVFSSSWGSTRTTGNFVKATFIALSKTYKLLSPDLWPAAAGSIKSPLRQYADFLMSTNKRN